MVQALKHRIELQEETKTPDGQGGFITAWATVATVWAGIEPAKGYERYQAQQIQVPVTHKITMRYRAVTTANRLVYGSRVFGIKEVLNVNEESRFLQIKAIEQA